MSNEIQIHRDRNLSVAGLQLSENSLIVPPDATDEQMGQIAKFLQRTEESKSWWWGDFLVAIETRKGEHYASEWVELSGLDGSTLRNYKWCAKFFDPSCRKDGLSFSHHWEAMAGSDGDIAIAQNWLGQAHDNQWSKSQLRKAIRTAKGEHTGEEDPGPPSVSYAPLLQADCWSVGGIEQLREMPKNDRIRLWQQIQGLVSVVDYLRSEVGE